jgi:hypothetical protein
MKCKQGQLAFINKSLRTSNIGKIVTCIRHMGHYSIGDRIVLNGETWLAYDTYDHWLIGGNIETQYGMSKEAYIMDS